jgi:outer membrane receptor protein involved in Fe transport
VPLNPFGPTADSPTAIAWIATSVSFTSNTTMDDVSGSVSGAPFSTWAGPVNVAGSGEWRKLAYFGTSSAVNGAVLDCTGLRFNCTSTTRVQGNTSAPRSLVSESVSEGALEVDAPVLKDRPFVQSLNINGAVRYTAYSISGSYLTWKVGVDWHATDEIRFRGTRSRDIRAPTLDDLFAPATVNISNNTILDLLTLQNVAGVATITTGNPNLTSEYGDTWTGGMVLRPKWLPGFSLSVDYFNSTVSNAIFPILANNATINRACIASGGTSPYCQTIVRPFPYSNTTPANNLTTQYSESINLAEQFTHGLDIEANYATRLLGRPASIRWLTTYQPLIQYFQPATVTLNQAGAAFGNNSVTAAAIWRGTFFLRYSPFDNFTIDTSTQWRIGLHPAGDPTLVFASGSVPPASVTNVNLAYTIKGNLGQTEVFLNISDIFNPAVSRVSPFTNLTPGLQNNYVTSDNGLGRAFTVGVRFKH